MTDDELLEKILPVFQAEARDRIANMSSQLLELEKVREDARRDTLLEEAFRSAHSLKGAARAVGMDAVESLCQIMEDQFTAIRDGRLTLAPEHFDALHDAIRGVESCIDAGVGKTDKQDVVALEQRLEEAFGNGIPSDRGQMRENVDEKSTTTTGGEQRLPPVGELPTPRPAVEGGFVEKSPGNKAEASRGPEGLAEDVSGKSAMPRAPASAVSGPGAEDFVRIPLRKLDPILLKAEELVSLKLLQGELATGLCEIVREMETWKERWTKVAAFLPGVMDKAGCAEGEDAANLMDFLQWNKVHLRDMECDVRALTKSAQRTRFTLGVMVDDLLDDMMNIRMQPVSTLFDTLPRMVRDISRKKGKQVDVEFHGGDVEIDRRILEEVKDPVIHLLRNAVDHGIEMPDVRQSLGKPAKGRVKVSISQAEGSMVDLVIADDGQGIDTQRVRTRAVKSGILSEREAAALDDRDACFLIFRSGLSTSAIITDLSGRGLGMAIVQEKVEKLGGQLSIENAPGVGAAFHLRLPLTLATFRGILVRVAERSFILPSVNVGRVLRVARDQVQTVENRATIPLNGSTLSLLDLARVLDLPVKKTQETGPLTVLVIGSGIKQMAFAVDQVVNEQEVLVKDLGPQLKRVPNIAGGTILGSGEVVPVLDVNDLLTRPRDASFRLPLEPGQAPGGGGVRSPSVLLVEDSITSRMLLMNILDAAGYDVKTAVDGMEAFSLLKTERFDLVVSDVDMPRMNGFELTVKIRADDDVSELPIVLVTSRDSREDREKGIDAGANAYIVKSSFDQTHLLDVISRLV